MNRFDNGPSTATVINGTEYHINENYDGCCMVWDAYDAMTSGELSEQGYCAIIIEMMYVDPRPPMFCQEALRFASDYLNYFNNDKNESGYKSRIPPISIRQDWHLIVASLLPLGVDLRKDMIDYGKFHYLLQNLPEGCPYSHIMYLRNQYYNERGKMKPDERKHLNEQIAKVGKNKVIIKNRSQEKEENIKEDLFKKMKNKARIEAGLPPIN